MAVLHLWLLQLRQKSLEEANTLLKELTTRYRFADLAPIVPESVRREILDEYEKQRVVEFSFKPRSPEALERLFLVQGLFHAPELSMQITRHRQIQALHEVGKIEEAIELARKLMGQPLSSYLRRSALWDYAWLSIRARKPALALEEVRAPARAPEEGLDLSLHLLPHRAVLRANLGQRKEAEEDLEQYRRRVPVSHQSSFATLLYGALLEQRKDKAGAVEAWRRGYRERMKQAWSRHDIATVLLGSLGNDVSDGDARLMMEAVRRGGGLLPGVESRFH